MKGGFLSLIFLVLQSVLFAQNIDSLKTALESTVDEEKIKILSDLSWYLRSSNSQQAWIYGNEALKESIKLKFPKGEAQAYNDLGILLFDKNEFDSAMVYYHKSLDIRKELDDVQGIAALYNKIGIIHQTRRNLDAAVDVALIALSIYDTLGRPMELSNCLNNLAVLYFNSSFYDQAELYHFKALKIRKEIGNSYLLGSSYVNMANMYSHSGDSLNTIRYYDTAITYLASYATAEAYPAALNSYASFLVSNHLYTKALPYLEEALELRLIRNKQIEIISSSALLGFCYAMLNKPKKAISLLLSAKENSEQLGLMQHKKEIYEYLSAYYEVEGNNAEALRYHKMFSLTKDSILNENLNSKISEMSARFETKKKELEITNLLQDNNIQVLEIDQKESQLLWTIIGSVALLVISLLGFLQYKSIQKRNLSEALIDEQQKGLNAVIYATEEERKRIAKDLHDGVGQQLSGLRLFFSKVKDEIVQNEPNLKEDLSKFENVLDNACSDVRSISHQMMPKTLMEKGLVDAFEDMLSQSLGLSKIDYNFEHFGIKTRFEERIEISVYRICQELVNNVLKHSLANHVSIQLIKNKNHLMLLVEDNGKGFIKDKSKDGIGQLNMSSRISTLNGSFSYDSEPGKGTVATIRIPI